MLAQREELSGVEREGEYEKVDCVRSGFRQDPMKFEPFYDLDKLKSEK